MAIRQILLTEGEYYHIYNRGNSKQIIFHDEQDYRYFMDLLLFMNSKKRLKVRDAKSNNNDEAVVFVGVFCLMPNHFHLLLKQKMENGITIFMQKLSTSYVMYYNKKYKRRGGLFEGRFKAKHASDDVYLKYLFSYIHLNPIKLIDLNWKNNKINGKKYEFLEKYKYSSFNEYKNNEYVYVSKKDFPKYFPTADHFLKEISYWLKFENK